MSVRSFNAVFGSERVYPYRSFVQLGSSQDSQLFRSHTSKHPKGRYDVMNLHWFAMVGGLAVILLGAFGFGQYSTSVSVQSRPKWDRVVKLDRI